MFDWIERLGLRPDNGDGTAELLILLIALSAVLIGASLATSCCALLADPASCAAEKPALRRVILRQL